MTKDADGAEAAGAQRARRQLRRHATVYLLAAGVMIAADWADLLGWSAFWPVVLWGAALGIHYSIFKALHADARWADRRVRLIRRKAYDLKHIEQIEQSYQERNKRTRPRPKGE